MSTGLLAESSSSSPCQGCWNARSESLEPLERSVCFQCSFAEERLWRVGKEIVQRLQGNLTNFSMSVSPEK